jgi:hypothetical protein
MTNEIENSETSSDENESAEITETVEAAGESTSAEAFGEGALVPSTIGREAGTAEPSSQEALLERILETAIRWRDTGSRYRTDCARQMLDFFGLELPGFPPADDEPFESHVKIPVGGLVADLDFKLRRQREDIVIAARRLGSHLLTLADTLEASPSTPIDAYGVVGNEGAALDRLCSSYGATKDLRREMGRVAFHLRNRG